MLKSCFTLLLFAAIAVGCKENAQTNAPEDLSESVYILHNVRDTSVHSYYTEIIESNDFIHWRFNWDNPDTSKRIGHSNFDQRTIKIQDKTYFEMDLTRYTFVEPHVSTIPTEHVCTFRLDLEQKNIKIFDQESEKFIDYRTEEGKRYFKTCLDG